MRRRRRWMGRVKGTVIVAGVLTATAGLAAYAQDEQQESRRERIIVAPQVQMALGDRAQLGVALREVDEAAAKEHKLPVPEGALVDRVEPGSAAEKAGIKAGDV